MLTRRAAKDVELELSLSVGKGIGIQDGDAWKQVVDGLHDVIKTGKILAEEYGENVERKRSARATFQPRSWWIGKAVSIKPWC